MRVRHPTGSSMLSKAVRVQLGAMLEARNWAEVEAVFAKYGAYLEILDPGQDGEPFTWHMSRQTGGER